MSIDQKYIFNGSVNVNDSKYKYDCLTLDVRKVYLKANIQPSSLDPYTHLKRAPINIAI
jgi:hypothetical protein